MSWDDLSQSRHDWPTIRECHAYRKTAYEIIIELLEVGPAVCHLLLAMHNPTCNLPASGLHTITVAQPVMPLHGWATDHTPGCDVTRIPVLYCC